LRAHSGSDLAPLRRNLQWMNATRRSCLRLMPDFAEDNTSSQPKEDMAVVNLNFASKKRKRLKKMISTFFGGGCVDKILSCFAITKTSMLKF